MGTLLLFFALLFQELLDRKGEMHYVVFASDTNIYIRPTGRALKNGYPIFCCVILISESPIPLESEKWHRRRHERQLYPKDSRFTQKGIYHQQSLGRYRFFPTDLPGAAHTVAAPSGCYGRTEVPFSRHPSKRQ